MSFERELDLYEREAALHVGAFAAGEMRREMRAHLAADVASRVEMGVPEGEAEAQALAALGDLRAAARAERREPSPRLLVLAPVLFYLAFFVPQKVELSPLLNASHVLYVPWLVATVAGSIHVHRLRLGATMIGATLGFLGARLHSAIDTYSELGYVQTFPLDQYLVGYVALALPTPLVHALILGTAKRLRARRLRRG